MLVAQLVEHRIPNPRVGGSSPSGHAYFVMLLPCFVYLSTESAMFIVSCAEQVLAVHVG